MNAHSQPALWPGTLLQQITAPGYVARFQQCEWPSPNVYEFESPETVLVLTRTRLPAFRKTSFIGDNCRTDFLDPGEMVLMPGGVRVHSNSDGGQQRAFCLSIDPERPEVADLTRASWATETLRACMNVTNAEVKRSMLRLLAEVRCPGLAAQTVVEALGMYISAELGRSLRGSARPEGICKGGLTPLQLRRIETAVREDSGRMPTVSGLATEIGFSRRHLARAFRQSTGTTLSHYIENVRAQEGTRLVCQTRLPLKEIANRLGYSSTSAFSSAFRRATGTPPGQLRKAPASLS